MAGFSTYYGNLALNWIKGTTFATAPTNVYMALYSSDPTASGSGGTDVTSTIRTAGRLAVPNASFGTSSTVKSLTNSAAIDFGTAAAGATVAFFGLWDASSAGNMIMWGAVSPSVSIATSQPCKFDIGALTLTC